MRAVPKAFAYLRESSAPTLEEQRRAIERHASDLGCRVVTEFSDPVISETDPVAGRTGFEALLARLESERRVKLVLISDSAQLGRHLMPRLIGTTLLSGRGVRLVAADGEDISTTLIPTSKLLKLVGNSVSEYEKKWTQKKILRSRQAKRAAGFKIGGRKKRSEMLSPVEAERFAEAIALAKKLRRSRPSVAKPLSYSAIAARLLEAGHLNERGVLYSPASIKAMVDGDISVRRR